MILAKNLGNRWASKAIVNGETLPLPVILIPGSEVFNEYINKGLKFDKFYDKRSIRKGSVVRLSDDPDDYFYGFMGYNGDGDEERIMYKALNSIQTIRDIFEDGTITFENPDDEDYLNLCDYGITEIVETITY